MPSGHIATATTTFIVIAENYPEKKWIKSVGYVLIGGISTALVAISIHWWSDIPFGIAIGYTFGMIDAHPLGIELNGFNKTVTHKRLSLQPIILGDANGLVDTYSF